MPRPSRTVWALLLFVFAGCSLVTDFDRDKLGASPDERDEAGVTTPGSNMDAQVSHGDGQVTPTPGVDGSIVEEEAGTGAACQTHANCGRNQLCCGGSCIATTDAHCSECEQGCMPATANQCNDRVCGCGAGPACSGEKPFCQGTGAAATCVSCRDTSDCEKSGAAGKQCIQGVCAACDPANNSGCSGDKPICNKTTFTCEACKSSPDNCPGNNSVCTPSGACGGCTANDMADCTNPTAPICNLTSNPTICRGCMSDGECMTEWNRPFCVNSQRCSTCRPSDDMGCVATSTTPDCRPNAQGVYTCQGCQADSCGTGLRCNTQTGKCVACRNDDDCDTNSATPFCDGATGTCRGCTAVGGQNAANLWCTANTLLQAAARPICNTTGRCVRCDAANATVCTGNTPRCYVPDATMPQMNVCVGCRPGVAADCTGATPICDATTRRCRGCASAADCSASAPVCNTATGTCARCTLNGTGAAAGCANANAPFCIMGNAGPECVECNQPSHCPAATPICNVNSHQCVRCNVGNDAHNTQCGMRTAGTRCVTGGTCARCDATNHDGCQITQLCCGSGAEGPACQDTGANQCMACGAACNGTCAARICVTIPDAGIPPITTGL